MTYSLFDSPDYVRLQLIGIGLEGYQSIQAIQKHYDSFEFQELSYAQLISHKYDSYIEKNSSIDVILYDNEVSSKEQIIFLEKHIEQAIGNRFKSADAIFLFIDDNLMENIIIAELVVNLINQKKIADPYFSIAFVYEPMVFEKRDNFDKFSKLRKVLLANCDLVIESPSNRIVDLPVDDQFSFQLQQRKEQINIDSFDIFIDLILGSGLICIDFADVNAVVQKMHEGISITHSGHPDKAQEIAFNIVSKLEKEWGDKVTKIGAVLINVKLFDFDFDIFELIGDTFIKYFDGRVRVKIGSALIHSYEPEQNNKLTVVLLAATNIPTSDEINQIKKTSAEEKLEQLFSTRC